MPGFLFAHSSVESGMRWLLKRWWFWAGTGFMLVAVCAGYLLIPVEKARITQENCDKIQEGWSPEQVVSYLGKPQFGELPLPADCDPERRSWVSVYWCDEDGNAILVAFNMNEVEPRVASKEFGQSPLSFFERMKGRIERRIRALWP
jgi:hypothetical protein